MTTYRKTEYPKYAFQRSKGLLLINNWFFIDGIFYKLRENEIHWTNTSYNSPSRNAGDAVMLICASGYIERETFWNVNLHTLDSKDKNPEDVLSKLETWNIWILPVLSCQLITFIHMCFNMSLMENYLGSSLLSDTSSVANDLPWVARGPFIAWKKWWYAISNFAKMWNDLLPWFSS